jgi:hypothetical protein
VPNKKRLRVTFLLLTALVLLACGLFSSSDPTPAPIQPTDTPVPPTDTSTPPPPTVTLPPPSPRPTITATPAPEWMTDFAEPILAEISSRPPDLKDDFSHDTNAWELHAWQAEWRKSIKDDEMVLMDAGAIYQGINFHDYVVAVSARQIKSGWHGIDFANYPWHQPSSPEQIGFNCSFKVWGRNVHFGCGIYGEHTDINKEITNPPTHTFLLIVKGGRIATYLDNKPIGYFEDDRYRLYRGSVPYVALFSENVTAFSEFKVWNITKFETP